MGELFEVLTSKKRFDANKVQVFQDGKNPYVVRTSSNNGQRGFIVEDESYLNEGNTISFGQDTATMFYQEKPYFTGDKIKVLKAKNKKFNKNNAQFFISTMAKAFSTFSWGSSSFNVNIIENQKLTLPTQNGKIDFAFMEQFIAELEAERIAELEAERIAELEAYLRVTGLSDYILTEEEKAVLEAFRSGKISWGGVKLLDKQQVKDIEWRVFNLEKLFGKSTRGRRLRSQDRISGNLPFVTAGEANEGISDFIGNDVIVFSENTTTIDMFGSAKYRNYKYGGDDHIAVVHTENLPKYAAIYVTTAIHKVSYAGQFSYSRNFYAKDADNLNISLPSVQGKPMYDYMEVFIRAVQKLVIKDVVQYAERKVAATRAVVK